MGYQGISRSFALVVLSAVLSLLPVAALSYDSASNIKISNFQKVSPEVWRGAQPSESDLKDLHASGVKTVINLRGEGESSDREANVAAQLGMKYIHIPMGFGAPSVDKVNQILKAMTDPQNQPVFVHCRQGADRTGLACGIYRMMVQGWTFDQTYDEMRNHHFKPFLVAMKRTVQAWEPTQPVGQSTVAQK